MSHNPCYLLAALPLMTILAAGTTTAPPTKTSLWEVSSAQRTAYIASDTQVLSSSDYPLPAPFNKMFAVSGELFVEQIPGTSKKSQAEIHSLVMKQGILAEDKTLEDVLTSTQFAAVKAAAKKQGTAFPHIERMRPWLLAVAWNALAAEPSPRSSDAVRPQLQLTPYFYQKAQTRGIPTTPFESYARLFDLASSLPMQAQSKWLMLVIKPDDAKKRELAKAWRAGNTATVKALSGGFDNMPKVRQTMVLDRNKTWVDVLENKLRTQGKPIFVVVGDGHLMGQENMLMLLREDGFQVRQL